MLRLFWTCVTSWAIFGPGGVFHTRYQYVRSVRRLPSCETNVVVDGLTHPYCLCALRVSSARNQIRQNVRQGSQPWLHWFSRWVGPTQPSYVAKYASKYQCDPTKNATCAHRVCATVQTNARRLNWRIDILAWAACFLGVVQCLYCLG